MATMKKHTPFPRSTITIAIVGLALFAAGLVSLFSEDREGQIIRLRTGTSLTIDTTSVIRDEQSAWTLSNLQLNRLSSLSAGKYPLASGLAPTNGTSDGDSLTVSHGTNKWATISGGGGDTVWTNDGTKIIPLQNPTPVVIGTGGGGGNHGFTA